MPAVPPSCKIADPSLRAQGLSRAPTSASEGPTPQLDMGLVPPDSASLCEHPSQACLLTPFLSFPQNAQLCLRKACPGRQLAFWDEGLWCCLLFRSGPWLGTDGKVVTLWAPQRFWGGFCSFQPGGCLHEDRCLVLCVPVYLFLHLSVTPSCPLSKAAVGAALMIQIGAVLHVRPPGRESAGHVSLCDPVGRGQPGCRRLRFGLLEAELTEGSFCGL